MTLKELINRHGSDLNLLDLTRKVETFIETAGTYKEIFRVMQLQIERDLRFLLDLEDSKDDPNYVEFQEIRDFFEKTTTALNMLWEEIETLASVNNTSRKLANLRVDEYAVRAGNLGERLKQIILEDGSDEQ